MSGYRVTAKAVRELAKEMGLILTYDSRGGYGVGDPQGNAYKSVYPAGDLGRAMAYLHGIQFGQDEAEAKVYHLGIWFPQYDSDDVPDIEGTIRLTSDHEADRLARQLAALIEEDIIGLYQLNEVPLSIKYTIEGLQLFIAGLDDPERLAEVREIFESTP